MNHHYLNQTFLPKFPLDIFLSDYTKEIELIHGNELSLPTLMPFVLPKTLLKYPCSIVWQNQSSAMIFRKINDQIKSALKSSIINTYVYTN